MGAVDTILSSMKVTKLFVQTIEVNEAQIKNHLPKEIFAAHWAYVLVQEKKLPFRQAYTYVKKHLSEIPAFDAAKLLKIAASQGSTGNLQLSNIKKSILEKRRHWVEEKETFEKVIEELIGK